jgi:hypothetical protein
MNDSSPAYDLIPQSLKSELPPLYGTQNQADPLARIKLFTPDSSWTWYVLEYSPDEQLCFGLVIGHERELGYFSLEDLQSARGPYGLPVERDLYFEPTPVSQCS